MEINPIEYAEYLEVGYDFISWHISMYKDNPELVARPGKISGLVDMIMGTLPEDIENRGEIRQYFVECFTNRLKECGYAYT
jgi:hypothetical protein